MGAPHLLLLGSLVGGGVTVTGLDAGGARPATAAALIAVTGLLILVAAHLVVQRRERVGAVGIQFALIAVVGTLLGAASAWISAVGGADALADPVLLACVLLSASVVIAWAAYGMGMAVGHDIDHISAGLAAVGEGDRTIRLDVRGGDQVARLARAGNRMIDQLVLREAERDEAQATRHELVRAMVDQLRANAAERDRAEERRRHLLAGVSHDLRTPLTALQLLARAIRDDMASPEQRAGDAERMLAQIASLTHLTEQVFELSRLEAGDVQWPRVRMPIEGLVSEVADQMRPSGEARGVSVLVELSEPLPPVELAPGQIARVLVNLVQNALEHTPSGGHVRIAVRATDTTIDVQVADSGTGVAAEDREHIFDAFYRGGAHAARSGSGTGLGLAISRAIVEAHGGRIELLDPERGSIIGFSLPR